MKHLLATIALLFSLALTSAAEPPNLMTDGGFENGIDGWRTWNDDAKGSVTLRHSLESAAEGEGCLLLETSGTDAHSTAYFILPEGKTRFRISGQARVSGGSVFKAVIGLQAMDEGSVQTAWETITEVPADDQWNYFEGNVELPDASSIALVLSLEGEGTFALDDLSIISEE